MQVNGEVVREPGTRVETERDRILVDGREVQTASPSEVYLLLYKPAGYIVATQDRHGRKTVFDLLRIPERIFSVGRLDLDAEGALLLTNDGELAFRLTHPKYEIEKVYRVLVTGIPERNALRRMAEGIQLEDGPAAPAEVRMRGTLGSDTTLEIVLREGRKRQVKRMCEAIGHPARHLLRTHFAGLDLEGLSPGTWRHLSDHEVEALRRQVGLPSPVPAKG